MLDALDICSHPGGENSLDLTFGYTNNNNIILFRPQLDDSTTKTHSKLPLDTSSPNRVTPPQFDCAVASLDSTYSSPHAVY
jgi:hypothetical protein